MNVAGSTYNCHFLYNGLVILTLEEPVIQPVYFFFIYSSCSLDLFHFFLYLPSIQQLLGQNCLFSEQNKKSLVETKAMVVWYYCAAGRRERGKNIAFGFKGAVLLTVVCFGMWLYHIWSETMLFVHGNAASICYRNL